jgi:hypothetical protein
MKFMLDKVVRLKIVFLIIVLFASLVQISCSPQTETKKATEKCEIELKDLLPFRGLKIGMPLKLEPSKLPEKYQTDSSNPNKGQEIDNVQELGYIRRTLYINGSWNGITDIKLPNTINTIGLKQINVATFDGNLVEFRVEYDEKSLSVEYTTLSLANTLKLPRGSFELNGIMSACFCKDFIVTILHLSSGIVLTIDPNYESTFSSKNISKILIERDKERTLKKQNTFTP